MRKLGTIFASLVSVLIIGASLIIIFRQDDVIDWWLLRSYDPPAEIVQLAADTTMTDLGRRYFYVYQPELLGRDTFRQRCTIAEKSIVLGCYLSRQAIYIFDVSEEQLEGIKQVTAAHEMMHVAYERLSSSERERIDRLNLEAFDSLENERVISTMQAYRERDPSIVANELHSVLPTEVRELSDELEEYYAQFFEDRLQVVAFSEQYASVFEQARQRVAELDQRLEQKRQEIDSLQDTLERQARRLEREREQLNRQFEAGEIEAYNAGVDAFNAGVRSYNVTVNTLRSRIDAFNRLVAERNNAAVSYETLTESIDSRAPELSPL